MVDAVTKAGVVNMVCHNYRRIPAIVQAKRMIEAGDLGTIYHYRARYAQDWIVDPNFPLVWRLQSKIAGSGTHGDIDAHIIDLGRYLIGEFSEVCGQNGNVHQGASAAGRAEQERQGDGRRCVMFIGRFANGTLANLEATRFAPGRKNAIQIEINGSKGSLAFDFEDMNQLKYYNEADPADRRGFRDILVTQGGGVHPTLAIGGRRDTSSGMNTRSCIPSQTSSTRSWTSAPSNRRSRMAWRTRWCWTR